MGCFNRYTSCDHKAQLDARASRVLADRDVRSLEGKQTQSSDTDESPGMPSSRSNIVTGSPGARRIRRIQGGGDALAMPGAGYEI